VRLTKGLRRDASRGKGQALVEFALVFPIFMMLLMGIVVFGLYVFYNQQLTNAVREAARYASIHSSTAQCPTVSRLDPPSAVKPKSYSRCDAPEDGWPLMTDAGRSNVWGMASSQVKFTACWSGYLDGNTPPNYDALPVPPNTFVDCTMRDASNLAVNPQTDPQQLACPSSTIAGSGAAGDDKASDTAADISNNAAYPTTVTVYGCFVWTPPLAGFVLMPGQIVMRSVVTEAMQRQQ
jgi:hypothetical protein